MSVIDTIVDAREKTVVAIGLPIQAKRNAYKIQEVVTMVGSW